MKAGTARKVKQLRPNPTTKVVYGGIAGALSVIVVWVLNAFKVLPDGTQVPGEIASALTTILSFIVSYVVSPSADDQITDA